MLPQDSPAFPSGIRDNRLRGSVGTFLREKIKDGATLSIVSAYFTIYAFEKLKDRLTTIENLNFLFGEPRFIRSLDPNKTNKKSFKIEDEGLQLQNRLEQKHIAKECAEWLQAKAQIRSVRQSSLLHGKMYHIAHDGIEDAILGSSNFTVHGLGLGENSNNIELNLIVDSRRDLSDLKAWFDEIWNNLELVEDVKEQVLQYLAQLYENHSPEFIYYKTLFHLFEKYLEAQAERDLEKEKNLIVNTQIWNTLFEFQKDGVKGAINKILNYNGCILADSVGLGKTYEALAVIKYFELLNQRVLVLCPKKLRENWTIYQAHVGSALNPFPHDRFGYTVLSHTDLSRDGGHSGDIDLATFNWGAYDLVVIDESHNFRNNTRGRRAEEGNVVRKSRYERLMEDIIRSGVKTKVLLLSATPVNNDLKDLRNQLYIITEGSDSAFADALGVASLQETLKVAQQQFARWASESEQPRDVRDLLDKLSSAFFKLLDALTIARSRKHVLRYYPDEIERIGAFPIRRKPISVFPKIDLQGKFMSYDQLNKEISKYELSLFNPTKYVLPQYREQYERKRGLSFSQSEREHFLIGMMKVGFLKRLESSVRSFAITMKRTVDKIDDLEERIKRFKQFRAENPDFDFDDLVIALDDEEVADALQFGEKLKFQMAHLDVDRWLHDLRRDRAELNYLYGTASEITPERDAKLAELKRLIKNKVKNPTTNRLGKSNRKVLVFTAFADTATNLYSSLVEWARKELGIHIALVTGSGSNQTTFGRSDFNHILTNFSPVSKQREKIPDMPQQGEIDLLIATDCISEGQNLQDCDYLINYDIHWNPVRVIQRFGRIDRIGSQNAAVQLVNFWPTEDLEQYIDLKNRVEARMALVDIAATFEDNILNTDELERVVADELKYRDKQLIRLKDEVLDLEDFNETVALNEFTLDDFRLELSRYLESNRQLLQDAPFGLYAVVPHTASAPQGVIFCLRQKGDTSGNETVNPLQPYFLVYVTRDLVRYSFAQPKQTLELYRDLCAGKSKAYEELCNLFDQETRNGADMTLYNDLLKKAVDSIEKTFKKRAVGNLLSGRGGVLPEQSKQVSAATDFDLITWLVIR